jgi:PAS domain S-box-containing protein
MAGLYIKGTNNLQKYQQGKLILNRPVYSINETPDRCFWFGTDYGIYRWNGRQLVNYTVQHGLAGYETNRAANITDQNGNVWIGTAQGLSRFKKDFPKTDTPPPLAELSYLKVSGKRHSPQDVTTIKPWQRNLEIHFNGLSFIDEKRIFFQTKLEGYDSDWSTPSSFHNRMVNYQNLPPGTYRFHMRVKNALDVWSEEAISADIIIPRPFYSTWWFYLLALLCFLALLHFTVKYLARRKYAQVLEQKVIQGSARLKASEERYHTLFQESKDAVFFTKRGGKLLDINPAGLEMLGFASKEEIMAINFSRDVFKNLAQRKRFLKDINQKGFVKDYELTLKRKDQSAISVEITATSIRNKQGEMSGFRGIVRDITERKLLENQLAQATKMEAIGTLAGGVAHDLNNILSGLINYPELLLMKMPQDTPLKKYILPIKETGNKAATIVQDLLTLARRMVIITKPMDINKIVTEALETPFYKKILKFHPGVRFETQLAESTWPIQGSESQLIRILLNLCSNGAEALSGAGVIFIRTANQQLKKRTLAYERIEPGEYVVLSVTDGGEPLTSQHAARMFEPFFTKKVLGRSGTGLGMAVVWAIVQEHGGHITLNSSSGRGNTIELFFPAATTSKTSRTTASKPSLKKREKERILVVDDAEEQRKLAIEILERSGYQTIAVASGEEAVKFIKENEVDLVWLDMMLDPGMDGLETYQEIIRIRPGQKTIIVSGYSETPRVKEAIKLGVGAYVKKPYAMEKIIKIIHRELAKF